MYTYGNIHILDVTIKAINNEHNLTSDGWSILKIKYAQPKEIGLKPLLFNLGWSIFVLQIFF